MDCGASGYNTQQAGLLDYSYFSIATGFSSASKSCWNF